MYLASSNISATATGTSTVSPRLIVQVHPLIVTGTSFSPGFSLSTGILILIKSLFNLSAVLFASSKSFFLSSLLITTSER